MGQAVSEQQSPAPGRQQQQIALVDLLDRLLGTGVVLTGDVLISIAGVDLVEIRLRALITSVRAGGTDQGGAGGSRNVADGVVPADRQ